MGNKPNRTDPITHLLLVHLSLVLVLLCEGSHRPNHSHKLPLQNRSSISPVLSCCLSHTERGLLGFPLKNWSHKTGGIFQALSLLFYICSNYIKPLCLRNEENSQKGTVFLCFPLLSSTAVVFDGLNKICIKMYSTFIETISLSEPFVDM